MRSKVTYPEGDWFQHIRIHEAGHAVAYYLLGYGVRGFGFVSIREGTDTLREFARSSALNGSIKSIQG